MMLKLALALVMVLNLFNGTFQQYNFAPPAVISNPTVDNSQPENLITGITFDCTGKPTGFYKDTRFCDVYHVCVGYQQRKTYGCPQVGDRFYYDDTTKKCEFTSKNPSGCSSNNYYQQLVQPPTPVTSVPYPPDVNQVVEPWKQFVRQTEQFSCSGRSDGFYPSRWCNVFYRCFLGLKYEFLCAKQTNGDRLWWTQHSTSSAAPQTSSQCAWPCDINRQCTSPGGILIDNGNSATESTAEVTRVLNACNTVSNVAVVEDTSNDIFRLPDADNNCAGVADGTYQTDSKYCNIFHVCIAGKRKDFLCAKASSGQYELWWNDATKRCEWPCKVQCSKQIFGSSSSASDIKNTDTGINSADCAPNQPTNNNNYNPYSYGNANPPAPTQAPSNNNFNPYNYGNTNPPTPAPANNNYNPYNYGNTNPTPAPAVPGYGK